MRRRHRPFVLVAAAAAVVVAVGGLAFWLRASSDTPDSTGTAARSTTPVSTTSDPDAQARLPGLVPLGYPSGSCKHVAPPRDALAKVSCDKNTDPDGPPSATYTLVADKPALDAAFNNIVATSTGVNCPGNTQSPGPWRRNATPQLVSGTLFCGLQQNRPTLAWTDDAELLLSAVQTDPQGPTFDQLYAWWSTHS